MANAARHGPVQQHQLEQTWSRNTYCFSKNNLSSNALRKQSIPSMRMGSVNLAADAQQGKHGRPAGLGKTTDGALAGQGSASQR